MKAQFNYLISLLCIILILPVMTFAGNKPTADENDIPMLENPMTVQYLKKNLRKSQPRLVLNATIEKNLRKKKRAR